MALWLFSTASVSEGFPLRDWPPKGADAGLDWPRNALLLHQSDACEGLGQGKESDFSAWSVLYCTVLYCTVRGWESQYRVITAFLPTHGSNTGRGGSQDKPGRGIRKGGV